MFAAILAALLLCSCVKNQSGNQAGTTPEPEKRQATVTLQDGTKIAGAIEKSSDKEITIKGQDSVTHTIPMAQVQGIKYGVEAAAAPVEEKAPVESKTKLAPAKTVAVKAQPAPAKSVESKTQAPPKPVQNVVYEVPAGASIEVRAEETIDSNAATAGEVFAGTVAKDVNDNAGRVAIPKGSKAEIMILSASKGGNFKGASDLELSLKSVIVRGNRYNVEAEEVVKKCRQGLGANKRTAEFTGGGAALGALIGGIVGGGKGAAIGAASGAGAGAATQILTKGKAIKIPVESILPFRLANPLQIIETK